MINVSILHLLKFTNYYEVRKYNHRTIKNGYFYRHTPITTYCFKVEYYHNNPICVDFYSQWDISTNTGVLEIANVSEAQYTEILHNIKEITDNEKQH